MMKIIDLGLVLLTTFCLTANQVLLKIWLENHSSKFFPLGFSKMNYLFKPELILSIVAFLAAVTIWLYLMRKLEFSLLYPLISFSYIFGLLAAKFILNEQVPFTRWVGVLLILAGVFFITRE
jgi:drug/metabolite transporter (DMT)-like permease